MGDRYFDLANFSSHHDLRADEMDGAARRLLRRVDARAGSPRAADAARWPRSGRACGASCRRPAPSSTSTSSATPTSTSARCARAFDDPGFDALARGRACRLTCRPRPLRDHRRRRRGHVDRLPPRRAGLERRRAWSTARELTSGSTFHSAGLVGQLRSSVSLTQDDDVLGRALPEARRRRVRPRLDRVRRHPPGLHAGALGGDAPPGRLGEDVRPAARADLGRGGARALPADVHRRRDRRLLAADRRLPRPEPAHLRARRRRAARRLRRSSPTRG